MTRNTKLELTWPGKDEQPRLEPRILLQDPEKAYSATGAGGMHGPGATDNILIKGDNLLALKALEQDYAGKVKCIYIDPPYNTGSAFEHYDDGVEHSIWLSLMRPRLQILRNLLTEDGAIFVNIDFNEAHYLKVLMDEVFGRKNFQREIIWRIGWLSGFKTMANNFIRNHDTILFYAKNADQLAFRKQYIPKSDFPPRFNDQQVKTLVNGLVDLGVDKKAAREYVQMAGEIGLPERYPIEDTWNCSIYDRLNSIAVVSFSGESVSKMLGVEELKGQKSEALIQRVLDSITEPGDLVLDSFGGTGTTGAVAQKMGRRWILVEIGDHADTHIVPRLKKVIDGEDQSGISKPLEWKGGGGFRYFNLASSMLAKDAWGNWVIAKDYNPDMLAAAMCKHLGFTYAPSADEREWWRHGQSSETDFLYVTTQSLTRDALKLLSDEVGDGRSLMICAPAFSGSFEDFENLSCTKIPNAILSSCEWDCDDYSLQVNDTELEDEHAGEGNE